MLLLVPSLLLFELSVDAPVATVIGGAWITDAGAVATAIFDSCTFHVRLFSKFNTSRIRHRVLVKDVADAWVASWDLGP